MAEFVFGVMVFTLMIMLWVMLFFIFDTEILDGYFKQKIRNHFWGKVDEH